MRRPLPIVAAALALAALAARGGPALRADDSDPGSPWEDVVFLPESGISVLLAKDPRGVLLDRSSYLDLYRRARAARGTMPSPAVPWRAAVLRSDVEASVEGDRLRARVRLTVACRGTGHEQVALPASGAVVGATLDGRPATLGAAPDGKSLVLAVQGDGLHEAVLDLVATVAAKAGVRETTLPLPAALATRWSLEIPGRVTASSRVPAWRAERLSGPDRTRLVGYPGAKAEIHASWREGDEGTDLPPLVGGSVRTLAEVGERSLALETLLRIEVQRRPESRFELYLPERLQVLGVDSESPVSLSGEATEAGVHTIAFPEPFTGVRTVLLRCSRALEGPGAVEIASPGLLAAAPVERRLAVRFVDGLRGILDPSPGAVREETAADPASGAVDAVLRLARAETRVQVRTERPSARVRADVRAEVDLAEDGPWLAASFLYRPQGDRLYAVSPLLPAGFVPDAVAVSNDLPFLRSTTPEGRLSLVFPGGVDAGAAVSVTVRGRLPLEGWTAEDWTEKGVPFPRLDAGPVEAAEGLLGISVPPGIEVREESAGGMDPAAVAELRQRGGFTAPGLTLGYRFRGGVSGGSARAVRRPASWTATVGVLAVPEEDHVRFEAVVNLAVQRSGLREFRIAVRPGVGDRVRIDGPDVAERRRVDGPGADTWVVRLSRRVRDRTVLFLRADLPLPKDAPKAAVPMVEVEGATRTDLFVGVQGGGELEVTAAAAGLRDADPADLAGVMGPAAAGLLQAWRAERGAVPSLSLEVRRLPAAPLPPAFADGVSLCTVIGMDGVARTRLEASVRNADRQALEVRLPEGAWLRSARVAGEAVRPVKGAEGRLLVPLVRRAEPFPVVLVYEERLDGSGGRARLVSPDLGLPGGGSQWTVRLPDGSSSVEASGDFGAPPSPPGVPLLVRWMRRGLGGMTFVLPTAGRAGGAPKGVVMDRPAPMPAAAPAPQAEEGLEARAADDMAKKSEEPAKPAAAATPPPPEKKPEARMAGRATREGLFGMDLRLLQSGPAVTASRLTPGGALDLRWRTAASRAVGAVLTGLLAFLAGFLARRRGIPCPAWTVLALALFTAAPVVLASTDPAPWDGAAAGTLAFGVIALLQGIHRWDVKRASSRAAATTAAAVVAILLLAGPAAAQEGRKGAKIAPPPPEDAPDRVYAPYDPSRPETLRLPERVFLPYARYVELWNAAHPEDRMEPARPPVVASASYDARVEGRMLVVAARFDVDPADGGLVPLPPGAALDDLILDGKPAATAIAAPGGAVLVPVPKSATPGARVAIEATLRFPIGGREPGGEVRSPLPPAPRCRLTALLPIADPVLSLTAAGGWTSAPEGAATRLEADLGPVTALDLRWSPRGADAAGGRLRFEVSASADLVLREDHCVLVSSATVEVQAGTLDRLDLALPEGWEPRGVAGPAVASWTVAGTGDARRLAVRLAGATSGKSTVTVTALRVGAPPADGLEVPGLAADGAASDRLTVRVAAGRSSRLAATVAGSWERAEAGSPGEGVALDPARGERVQAAWRRTRPAGRLVVRAEPLPSALSVAARQHLFLGAEASLLAADLDIEPGPAGLFEASIALPAGWTLEDAQGGEAFAEPGRVRVLLPGPPGSTRTVRLRLRGPAAGDAAFAFPALRVEGATRESAELLVSTARGFAATAAPGAGMDPVPVDRFSAWPPLDPEEQRALGFRSARGPGDLSLRREAVRSTVRPMVIADVTVLDDRAIVDALLVYEVRGGPARVFRFRSPPGVKDTWVLGDGIRETRIETADGRETVTVTMQAAAAGEVSFRALYEIPVPPGAEVPVAGPEPEGGEAPRAFVFVRAAGDAEARLGDAPGMEPCDAADLPKIPEGLDPRRVLRFYRARDAAWRLPLRLVSHETGGVPDARIHLVEAVTVVDRDGSSRTRIEARLFNRALAFLPVVLPPQASLESVLAAGVPVRPVTRASEPGRVLVPVRRQSLGEDSQVVSLTFSSPAVAPGGRFGALEPRLPEFPDVPVDATTWRLLLPEDRDWAFGGNLDPVEEAEVEIARAEAYAEDIGRLRKVVNEGTVGQRTLAGENVVRNTRELRQTLERAQSRIDLLETAAAEGKVDQGRVAEARRKAQDLGKEIEDALKDVEKNAPQSLAALREPGSGPDRGPAGQPPSDSRMPDEPPAPDAGGGPFEADKRLSTKEAQAGKRWASNFRNDTVQQEEKSRDDARRANEQALRGQYGEAGLGAVVQHQQFDASSVEGRLVGGKDWGLPTLDATLGRAADFDTETAMLQPSGGGAFSIPPDVSVSLSGTLPASLLALKRGYAPGGGGGGGGHQYAGSNYFGSGGGSGAGGAVAVYGRAGLVSLTPPLEERDRAYAFRKLDAGAEMRITPRALDLGRRALAAAAFALVAGLVWLMMRRRAAAKR